MEARAVSETQLRGLERKVHELRSMLTAHLDDDITMCPAKMSAPVVEQREARYS